MKVGEQMGCGLITNGRCPYEVENKCTAMCGGERPYGTALCDLEELEWENPEELEITKEGLKEFLELFSKAIKDKK